MSLRLRSSVIIVLLCLLLVKDKLCHGLELQRYLNGVTAIDAIDKCGTSGIENDPLVLTKSTELYGREFWTGLGIFTQLTPWIEIMDTLQKRKQELLRKLDEDINQDLNQEDIETEMVDSDEYSFNLEIKVCQIGKFITVQTSTLNTNVTSFTNSRSDVPPSYPSTNNTSSTENQHNTHFLSDFRSYSSIASEYNKLPMETQHNAKETVLHSQTQTNVLLKTAVAQVSSGFQCTDANILFHEVTDVLHYRKTSYRAEFGHYQTGDRNLVRIWWHKQEQKSPTSKHWYHLPTY
ncbi:unnamed protein product [Mytilus coruscus]|uniref:Uncharacterized protein n=1 Tax=Mytilus coruscus TaxID=42192 RepID=A0A6J8EJJ1_MYTCO|nr:unnamed protein product [Mytilus coruscus]